MMIVASLASLITMNLEIIITFLALCSVVSAQSTIITMTAFTKIGCFNPEDIPISNQPSESVSNVRDCARVWLQRNTRVCGQKNQGVALVSQSDNVLSCTDIVDFTNFPNVTDTNCENIENTAAVYKRRKGTTCQAGWTFLGNYCYKLGNGGNMNFAGATAACQNEGGYLARPLSATENGYVFQIAAGNNAWIGLTDQLQEGVFVWQNGCPLTEPQWRSGEPNGIDGDEDCIHLTIGNNGVWNDHKCHYSMRYVCQREPDIV